VQVSSPTTRTRLGEQLFELFRQLTLDPEADHLRAVDELDLTLSQVRAIHMLECSDPEPLSGSRVAERLGISPAATSRALDGLCAPEVTVEVHLANGLPSFTLVGLADTEVKEARERVRAALATSGLEFPTNKRITVNLAPADLPKESGRFDLPIAIGILAASGRIDAAQLARYEFAGELSLAGDLRPVRGALAMSLALRRLQTPAAPRALVLPIASAREAALANGWPVYGAAHLLDVVRALMPPGDDPVPAWQCVVADVGRAPVEVADFAEVKGQAGAKRALEIAAAGGLSVVMVGPPGTGKSMLAHRFIALLPALTDDEALESAAVLSLTGAFSTQRWGQRVLRTPHHSASSAALVGGGSPPRPGGH